MARLAAAFIVPRLLCVRSRPLLKVSLASRAAVTPGGELRWLHGNANSDRNETPLTLTSQQKRILYRSKQRGWVELDLIIGAFTERCIEKLFPEDLSELEKILEEENVVLYGCLVGTNGTYDEPPLHLQDSHIFQLLRNFAIKEYPDIAALESKQRK